MYHQKMLPTLERPKLTVVLIQGEGVVRVVGRLEGVHVTASIVGHFAEFLHMISPDNADILVDVLTGDNSNGCE